MAKRKQSAKSATNGKRPGEPRSQSESSLTSNPFTSKQPVRNLPMLAVSLTLFVLWFIFLVVTALTG
jgi:hypothetical protein